MNDFVEECRREWKRLGVQDAMANEMAADLAADIAEAEAEGASAEAVVGSGAFDPPSFAHAWAAERGLVGSAPTPTRRRRLPSAVTVCVLLVIVGVVLVLVPRTSLQGKLAVAPAPHAPAFKLLPPANGPVAVQSAIHAAGEALLIGGLVGTVLVAALGFGRRRMPTS